MRAFGVILAAVFLLGAQASSRLPASLALIARFAHSSGPYHDVTVTAADANAYWTGAGAARLPAAVSQVVMGSEPGVLTGSARIDFDQLAAHRPGNPLLWLFAGEHTVALRARVDSAQAPEAHLTVTEVRLDGQRIPNLLIDAAVAAFVQPNYPKLGRHFAVPLPQHATTATAGTGEVTVHYPKQ